MIMPNLLSISDQISLCFSYLEDRVNSINIVLLNAFDVIVDINP